MSDSYVRTRQVARRVAAAAVVATFVLTIFTMSGQGDRSERLQEKVKSSDNRLDPSQMNTPPPINSMPQQALRKANDRLKYKTAKLAEANASLSAARTRDHHAKAGLDYKQEAEAVKALRAEVGAAKAEVIKAREAVWIEQRR
jgi:hypothetical protein